MEFSKDCHRLQDYDCYRVVLLHFDIMKQAKQPQARQNTAAIPENSPHKDCLYFGVIILQHLPQTRFHLQICILHIGLTKWPLLSYPYLYSLADKPSDMITLQDTVNGGSTIYISHRQNQQLHSIWHSYN